MKKLFLLAVVSAAGYLPPAANASHDAAYTAAEVRKVDKEGRKITLRHGEIRSLNMPPMSMVFQVNDPAMLDKYKPGDRIQFKAEDQGGKYVITAMQPDH